MITTGTPAPKTTYARAYRGRRDHLVREAGITLCGLPTKLMARWESSQGMDIAYRPTCEGCRAAAG
jgi:hypothetical protein